MNTDTPVFKPISYLAVATLLLLMIPYVGMQFSPGVNWTLSDFVIAGALLFGTGLAYILVTRVLAKQMTDSAIYRVAVGFALFTGLFLVWVNLAVGLTGSEDNPFNLYYLGVLAVGLIGAFAVRFRPKGMMITLFLAAAAQAAVALLGLVIGEQHSEVSSVTEILGVNGMFATLWVVSALLFRQAWDEAGSVTAESKV